MYLRERQDCPAGVQFYTCDEGFTGCCSVDACAFGGCPDEVHQINVRTLTLLSQPTTSRSILSLPAETTSSSASYTILGYYTIPPTPTPTAEGTNNAATSSSSKSSSKTPIIVGATIGGIAFLALVAFLAWFFFRRWRGRQRYAGSRGTTPMLGNHGDEKFGTRETPDSGALRDSVGGLFSPFGGYRQAPMDDEPLRAARDSMEIEEGGTLDVSVPNEEKRALVPPPDDEHPAYHPLPGKHLPAYVPGQPAYNSLPSQRSLAPPSVSHVPEQSPKIPGLVFTPIDISLGDAQLETIPITPKAELAASPVQPKAASPIPSSKFSTARRSPPPSSPPKNSPPADPAPLAKVATIRSPPRENGPLTNFSMKHISSPRPGYPSPTAGGKVELPASVPVTDIPVVSDSPVKAPLNPTPAFHHIYLPEPLSGISTSSMDTAYSTIPIGLGDDKSGSSTRSTNEPKQPKSSNLRHEHKRSPQTKQEKRSPPQAGHERKPSQQYTREEGSPPQSAQGKRRSPHTTREPRSSPPPKQQQEFTPPLPSGLSDTHPALRDQVRQNRGDTTPSKQGKQSPPTQQTQSPSQQERKSPPPLRQQRSDVSAMSDSYYPLREQPSELSMLTVSEESESAPVKSKKKKKWSASERDGMSLLVYKGDALIGQDEVSPLFSPQGASRRVAQSSEESDMSIQPLALQGREGWSAVPLTPMTPLNKTKAQKRADGMF